MIELGGDQADDLPTASEAEESADTAAEKPAAQPEKSAALLAAIAAGDAPPDQELKQLDFDVGKLITRLAQGRC